MPFTYPLRKESNLFVTGSLILFPSTNSSYIREAALEAISKLVDECKRVALEFSEEKNGGDAVWHVLTLADEWKMRSGRIF